MNYLGFSNMTVDSAGFIDMPWGPGVHVPGSGVVPITQSYKYDAQLIVGDKPGTTTKKKFPWWLLLLIAGGIYVSDNV